MLLLASAAMLCRPSAHHRVSPAQFADNAAFRSSQRVTITLPHSTFSALIERSNEEGRSLSNLAAYLLEFSLSGLGAAR